MTLVKLTEELLVMINSHTEYHIKQALKAASEVPLKEVPFLLGEGTPCQTKITINTVDKEAILNCYKL